MFALPHVRRTYLVALAVLVATFVALYPYLEGMDACMVGECPYAAQSSHGGSTGFMATCLSFALAASSAVVLALATSRGRRVIPVGLRPAQTYLSPDPPPPQLRFIR